MHNEERYQVLIIGAGQAGLAMGWHLQRQGLDFRILEAGDRPGGNWRHYYDSLKLFSPAGYSSLPGLPFPGPAEHYPRRDEVAGYLEDYARHFDLPIRLNSRVDKVLHEAGGFRLFTGDGRVFHCQALVVASGAFSRPYTPEISGLGDFQGLRLHSRDYRNPQGLHGRRVVVVGAANSAVQIAYELAKVAQVTLATREKIRFNPQRLLGLDIHFWLHWSGLDSSRWFKDQSTPVLDDGRYRRALREGLLAQRAMFQRATADGVIWADGEHERIDALIFATGYRPNLSFLDGLPVLGADGRLLQREGRALEVPGLFFVGQPMQRNLASATLRGAGRDAAHLLPDLLRHVRAQPAAGLPGLA